MNTNSARSRPENWRDRDTSHSFCKANIITLIPKQNEEREKKRKSCSPIFVCVNFDVEILNQILANQSQQCIKLIMYHEQIGLIPDMQGCGNEGTIWGIPVVTELLNILALVADTWTYTDYKTT